ncbi:MAG TPA: T9SS type A sorting domain-containing protein [Puia sp.]|nr:T9SS type A sorting domain-containing protein [Puia sp.]
MKKLYTFLLLAAFVLISFVKGYGQFTGGIFTTTASGGSRNISDPLTWVGAPPSSVTPCNNCKIIINGIVNVDIHDVVLENNSLVVLNPNATLNVNEYVEVFNTTEVIVGTGGTLNINDEVDLNSGSFIRLADNTASAVVNGATSHGPYSGVLSTGPGIYTITKPGPPFLTSVFDITLSGVGQGNSAGSIFFDPYTINCNASPPPGPVCITGTVFGPAQNQPTTVGNPPGAHGINEFVTAPVLPVELVQFIAYRNSDESINVSWSTSQETNSGYFNVERSADGTTNWQTIGTVKAKGFSSTTSDYSYKDALPLNGTNYYRLKMVDLDGKFKYSKVVYVTGDTRGDALVIYNNPFTDMIRFKVNVSLTQDLMFIVTDIQGKAYYRQVYKAKSGDNYVNISPPSLAQGVYMLHIQGNTFDRTVKLIKQ